MKKRMSWFMMALSFLALMLTGCNQYGELNKNEIQNIAISKVGEEGDVKGVHKSYVPKDAEAFNVISKAINSAKKIEGKVDVTVPDYYVYISFKDDTSEKYALWLSEDHGSMMNMSDTHSLYTIPRVMVKELNKYVE